MLEGLAVYGDKGVQADGASGQGVNALVNRLKLPFPVFPGYGPFSQADCFGRGMTVFAGASFGLGRMGIDGGHGEMIEAAADIALFVDQGHNILAAGCDNDDFIGPDREHGLFIPDIGTPLFPLAGSFLEGKLVQVGLPVILLDMTPVALGHPGGMA